MNTACKKTFGERYNYEEVWEDEYDIASFMSKMQYKKKYFPKLDSAA